MVKSSLKVIVITQARIGSTRLPSKVLKPIGNQTILSLHLNRLKKATLIDQIVVATTHEEGVDQIIEVAKECETSYYQGSTNDVLDRFYQAAKLYQADYVVRVTSDCPLIDPVLMDYVVSYTIKHQVDYCSNVLIEDFPDGQDIEVIKFSALEKAWIECKDEFEREHVTGYIIENCSFNQKNMFTSINYDCPKMWNHIRMTVDHEEDLQAIRTLVNKLGVYNDWKTYTKYIINHPNEFKNQKIIRNQGYIDKKRIR